MPERFTLNNKTYDIPDDKIGIFMSKYPNAVEVKQSFMDDLAARSREFMNMIPYGPPIMRAGGLFSAVGDAFGQKAQKKALELLTPEMADIAFGPKIGAGARQAIGLAARVGVDPTTYIGGPAAVKGLEKVGRFAKGLSKAKKVVAPIEQIADLRIPIFGAANKTEDALELGSRLKGSEKGIAKLKFLEDKFAKEFKVAQETSDFNELAVIAHKKQLYREAREVAEGVGGAADFAAKKPLEKIAEAKPLEKIADYLNDSTQLEKIRNKINPFPNKMYRWASKKEWEAIKRGETTSGGSWSTNLGDQAYMNKDKVLLVSENIQPVGEVSEGFRVFNAKKSDISEVFVKKGNAGWERVTKPLEKIAEAKPLEKIAKTKPVVKELTANQKLLKALKESKPLRGKQEQIYKEERGIKLGASLEEGKKVSGQEGFLAQRSKLRGEMTKVEFESLKGKIGQKDIDNLFDQVKTSTEISEWERFNAGAGLMKMFGEFGGTVPAKGELALLEKVFGKELAGELLKKQSAFKRFKEIGLDIANIPRSFMTSFDLSFGFRQGIFTLARHPALFAKNFSKQFKLFRSEKYYQEVLNEIRSRPNFETMQKSGLSFTELRDMTKREEAFMSSFAEKIPIAGPIVRASGRAFTGFADRLRADLFDYMLDYGKKMGVEIDKHFLTSSAEFINNATGRGNLPKSVEKVAVGLNAVFFSPRLMMSRVNLLNPYKYMKLHPTVRKEALKSLAGFAGMAMTVGGLAKLAGADVETDPRNADFMKIKTGNTRYDILGGFQQPVRAMAQIGSGKIISSTTGKEITLGEGYKPLTRLDVGLRFLAMKESPLFSFAHTMMEGVNAVGEKFDVSTEIANRFIPMVIQDMNDLYKEKGFKGIPMAAPAVFGVGVQSYGGVGSWGLSGNDYPSLNKELLRLKIPMGFPSMSVSGKELDLSEYKNLKDKTGKKIASELTGLIKSSEYGQYSTEQKKQIINKYIDRWKEIIKFQVYPEKFKK